jgi:hypothetical protein
MPGANYTQPCGCMSSGDGTVPLLFFFRDQDGNPLMIVEAQ